MRISNAISALAPKAGGQSQAGMGMLREKPQRRHDLAIYKSRVKGPDNLDIRSGALVGSAGVVVKYLPVYGPYLWETCFLIRGELWMDSGMLNLTHLPSPYVCPDRIVAAAGRDVDIPYIVRPHGIPDPYIFRHRQTRKAIDQGLFQNRVFERSSGLYYSVEDKSRLVGPVSSAGKELGLPICAA